MSPAVLTKSSNHNYHPAYRPDIDGLRAVAILSVVIFHAFPARFRGGFIGVDIFFVISGFLISSIIFRSLSNGDFNFFEFYAHRIRRIFPALILVMTTSLVFGWFVLLPDEYKQLGKHVAAGAGFLQNFVLLNEAGYFDNESELKPMMHLWSLAIEEQFYLAYPLIIWGAWKLGLNAMILVAVLGLFSFIGNAIGVSRDAVGTFFLPQTRVWELLAGSVLAYLYLFKRQQVVDRLTSLVFYPSFFRRLQPIADREAVLNNLLSALGLLLIVVAMLGLHKEKAFPGWRALAPVMGAFLLVMAGPHAWINRKILSNKLMVFIGLISYPLYLWHWPILSFARIVESETLSAGFRAAIVLMSFFLAWLTYRLIEKPVRFGSKPGIKSAALTGLMVLVGYMGFNTYFKDGYESRSEFAEATEELNLAKYLAKLKENKKHIAELEDDRQSAIRAPYCHMNDDKQTFEEFKKGIEKCMLFDDNKKNVLIIGDSHAADFYVAVASAYENYNFLQATGAGCAPDSKSGRCRDFLKYAIEFAGNNKLEAVVLAARWKPINYDRLSSSILTLKKLGQNVVLVGPPKTYVSDVHRFIGRRRPGQDLRFLSIKFSDQDNEERNRDLRAFAQANQIPYIDRINIHCHKDGSCPLINDDGDLLTADYGHLLRTGAHYLGQRLVQNGVKF